MIKLRKNLINKKIIFISFFILLSIFLLPNISLAGDVDVGLEYGEDVGLSATDPRIMIARIIQIFLGFLGILTISLIIYGGFLWMTSAGNEERIEKAKQTIKSAVIGLIIILASFGITTFLLNSILGALGPGGGGGTSGGGGIGGGIGVLGVCSVESVYPEPNQKDVARNTSIIVTFKEEIDPVSVCGVNPCNGQNIILDTEPENQRIKIYKTKDDETNFITNLIVYSNDNKTFVFVPSMFLGSPSEYLWYTVYFSNNILKTDGKGAFSTCRNDYLEWQFEVSNKIDLIPPQVKDSGVFPPPDDEGDEIVIGDDPAKATGAITVMSQPQVYEEATINGPVVNQQGSPQATAEISKHCQREGVLTITADSTNGYTAELSQGNNLFGSAEYNNDRYVFDECITLILDDNPEAGNSWQLTAVQEKQADTLTIGKNVYTFSQNPSSPNHIGQGANTNATAINIAGAINNTSDLSAQFTNNIIDITAVYGGKQSNNIVIDASNQNWLITKMSGGEDRSKTVTIRPINVPVLDQPMNSVIQINFNEAIMPTTVSGNSEDVEDYISVKNNQIGALNDGGACTVSTECLSFNCENLVCVGSSLSGKFVLSNQYKTVEFISNNQCGVNGCGESIYCLPELSNIKVEIMAGSLITCNTTGDCAAKSPFNNCPSPGAGACQDDDGINYPTADIKIMDGVMDVSFNSLDGNRNTNASGPINFYNENDGNKSNGDNFLWSFFISNVMEINPPIIEQTKPIIGGSSSLVDPVEINFNKIIMSSSLRTGQILVSSGQGEVLHKALNLWLLSQGSIGYWISKVDIDSDLDGQIDKTQALIKHNIFSESTSYRAQAGSFIKDIYQNCFKPSADMNACSGVTQGNPSCCSGVVTATLDKDGNCP